jgi:hypothetical protein
MPRPKKLTPNYKRHTPTGAARCWVNGKWVHLGKYGSPESRQAPARIVAQMAAAADPVDDAAPLSATPAKLAGLSVAKGLPGLGRRAEAGAHRTPRSAREGGLGSAPDRRPERGR